MAVFRPLSCVLLFLLELSLAGWQDNLTPRMFLQPQASTDYRVFSAADPSEGELGVSLVDGPHLLVGGRNRVYKLGLADLVVQRTLDWGASEQDKSVCLVKGKSEASCQNYIKVLKKYENDQGRYLICGTNAYKPECRDYVEDGGNYLMTKKSKGVGLCPYSPDHNSTALLVGDQLYAGTAADYQGVDPIIYRDPLRSPQFDSTYLNNPSFVGSFEDTEFVYFIFREGAVEYMNCGKSVFSRVARVCKSDVGGTRSLNAKWTSFLKARLNCSVPGNYPFYFDEIQDISHVLTGVYGEEEERLVYGVFNTPPNSIGGSAVCAFRIKDITAAFAGQFKEQRNTGDNWLAVEPHRVPEPRPGSCPNNSKELNDANLNFIKTHPLMNDAVPPFFSAPVLVRTGLNVAFTSVAVDAQVTAADGSAYDVLFVGTSNGRLLKAVNSVSYKSSKNPKTVIIEELEVGEGHVTGLNIVKTGTSSGQVLVSSKTRILSLPLYRCHKARVCRDCIALQDPYCVWDVQEASCRGSVSGWGSAKGSPKESQILQSVLTGRHSGCGGEPGLPTQSTEGGGAVISPLETLIITVSAGAALVVGFVTGY